MYVVTYNNSERINQHIERFLNTTEHVDRSQYELNYYVINNHSNFELRPDLAERINGVLHNSLRPDWSCGHLSRDYNAALMHGFRNLNEPYANQVITMHDDSHLNVGWFEALENIHTNFTFYAGDFGCSMISYLPDAVKKIGIWDERFCNIGYHEADYFLRAYIYNKDHSSINDHHGGRVLNETVNFFEHVGPNHQKNEHVNQTMGYHTVSRKVFEDKWNVHPEDWNSRMCVTGVPTEPLIHTYMFYPYFELAIENLEAKKYSYAPAGLEHFKNEWR